MPFGFGKRNVRKLEQEADAEGLIALLDDDKLYEEALNALYRMGVAAMSAILEAMRNTESQLISYYLSLALGRIGKPCVLPIIKLLPELNQSKAGMVIVILGAIGDPRAVEPLLDVIRDPSASVVALRNSAVDAIGEIGGTRAEEVLSDLIADGQLDASLRESAVKNLEKVETKRKG